MYGRVDGEYSSSAFISRRKCLRTTERRYQNTGEDKDSTHILRKPKRGKTRKGRGWYAHLPGIGAGNVVTLS